MQAHVCPGVSYFATHLALAIGNKHVAIISRAADSSSSSTNIPSILQVNHKLRHYLLCSSMVGKLPTYLSPSMDTVKLSWVMFLLGLVLAPLLVVVIADMCDRHDSGMCEAEEVEVIER